MRIIDVLAITSQLPKSMLHFNILQIRYKNITMVIKADKQNLANNKNYNNFLTSGRHEL